MKLSSPAQRTMAVLSAGDFIQSGAAIYFRKKNYNIMTEFLPYIIGLSCFIAGIIITWLVMNSQIKAQAGIHSQILKAAEEKQALLDKAEARLADTFKALSADALKSNQDQFLILAKNNLQAQQQEAKNDLKQRQTPLNNWSNRFLKRWTKSKLKSPKVKNYVKTTTPRLNNKSFTSPKAISASNKKPKNWSKPCVNPTAEANGVKSNFAGSLKWQGCRSTATSKPKPPRPRTKENACVRI